MQQHLKKIVVGVVTIKLLLAYFFPITSDEAYFYVWGQFPDVCYYDHPPMTGWVVYWLSLLGRHIFFSRLFSVAAGLLVAGGIYWVVKNYFQDRLRARLIALAFLVSPLHMLLVLVATDTPLFLFAFVSAVFFFAGFRRNSAGLMIISGVFLGLAVLSKYFSGLLLVSYGICLLSRPTWKRFKQSFAVVGGALPFVLLHLYWNYNSCWTNLLFNVFSRNKEISFSPAGFFSFLGFQLYLATPWMLYYLVKNGKALKEGVRRDANLFAFFFLIPLSLFGLISFHKIGLHWVIAFYPFLFFLLVYVREEQLGRIVRFSTVFSLLHVVPIFVFLMLPVETFRNLPWYHDLVLAEYGDEIYRKLDRKYGQDFTFATNGYYTSGALSYHGKRHVIVFLDYSKYGRYDDKITDYRKLDGGNILVFATLPIERDYTPYFESVTLTTLNVREKDFYVLLGRGFKYAVYREKFLNWVREAWYAIPDFLPVGTCYFYDRYFPERRDP